MNYTGEPEESAQRAIELLQLAVETARLRGYDATGYMLQAEDLGVSAWVYVEDETSQRSLIEDIELVPTLIEAARQCVARVSALPALGPVPGDG